MRQPAIDIARGMTVLIMPAVHVTMLYGDEAVYRSWLGVFLNWMAVFPGAQLFMLLMGLSFRLAGGDRNARNYRIIVWLVTGYALNVCKFLVPAWMHWLPASFYASIGLHEGPAANARLFFIGDILPMAALSYAVLLLLQQLRNGKVFAMITIVGLIVLSPAAWQVHIKNVYGNEVLSLVTGNDPLVFFPLFPWLVYPLAGYCLGSYWQSRSRFFLLLAAAGILFMLPGALKYGVFLPGENLYRPLPLQTLYHIGFCCCWLSWCAALAKAMYGSLLFKFLSWCSRHITLIYCTQWILIFWCIALLPYRGLSLMPTLLACVLLSLIVFSLDWTFLKLKPRKEKPYELSRL